MNLDSLKQHIASALKDLYQIQIDAGQVLADNTSDDFEGDYTFVVFPYLKQSRKGPEDTARAIGEHLLEHTPEVAAFNVIKGFLNITMADKVWVDFLKQTQGRPGQLIGATPTGRKMLVEYSSPNTNKPLHLGHVRTNLLGYSVAQILKANGHDVSTCNLVNDRGIHICKSMLAWMKLGNGETPESSGMKGDHFVGKYYVEFDRMYKKEIAELVDGGMPKEEAEKKAPSIVGAQELLQKWEAGDAGTIATWKMMNDWVYAGFDVTYRNLGVQFDKFYYESDTYLLGKQIVQEGLDKGVFYRKENGSVWVDLTMDGLDEKLVLRADGTSVYITQDIGTAELKYNDFHCERSIHVVGNEQDYHFKVLQLICKKLGKPFADGIYHLSYGMVELPEGKMKSREGTVVDADDLMSEMVSTAAATTGALGKTVGFNDEELEELYSMIGMGALKYFLLKVEPKRKMLFNPAESIDFHGNTGPFIQYTHARIRSVLRNAPSAEIHLQATPALAAEEKEVIRCLYEYRTVVKQAGDDLSPGLIANYTYELAKTYNQFYHVLPILKEEDEDKRNLRLMLCQLTADTLRSAFSLLGIKVPERM